MNAIRGIHQPPEAPRYLGHCASNSLLRCETSCSDARIHSIDEDIPRLKRTEDHRMHTRGSWVTGVHVHTCYNSTVDAWIKSFIWSLPFRSSRFNQSLLFTDLSRLPNFFITVIQWRLLHTGPSVCRWKSLWARKRASIAMSNCFLLSFDQPSKFRLGLVSFLC